MRPYLGRRSMMREGPQTTHSPPVQTPASGKQHSQWDGQYTPMVPGWTITRHAARQCGRALQTQTFCLGHALFLSPMYPE
eukprot:15906-Eustigmatos_ZCMA.PRE.1